MVSYLTIDKKLVEGRGVDLLSIEFLTMRHWSIGVISVIKKEDDDSKVLLA